MAPLRWETRPDGLRAPALVCAFRGWNDAGDAASAAVQFVAERFDAKRFLTFDPEDFYDFQSSRPSVRLTDGQHRETVWPEVEVRYARIPRAPRDLIFLIGPEPAMRWRTFAGLVCELCDVLDVQLVVSLGALLADVPHTQSVSIVGMASDEELVGQLGLAPTNYEGPTGITGVVHGAVAEAGFPCASLWASVPHYVAAAPNPKAALALVRRLESLTGVTVDATELETAAGEYERQVSLAVQSDPEVMSFVERLEQAAAAESTEPATELPSGDVIARDFQRFLRQRGPDA